MTPDLGPSLLGIFFTLAVFSYLLGDNPLFRLALNVFVGVTAGYLVYVACTLVLIPWTAARFVTGAWTERTLACIPLVLGIILFLKITRVASPRLTRLSGVVLAFFIGVGSAVAIGGAMCGTLLPQTWGLMRTFERELLAQEAQRGWLMLAGYIGNGSMVLIGALATMLSFHYGKFGIEGREISASRLFTWVRRIGKFFIAAALGVIFAGVFQAGLTALIERIQMLMLFLQGLAWPG